MSALALSVLAAGLVSGVDLNVAVERPPGPPASPPIVHLRVTVAAQPASVPAARADLELCLAVDRSRPMAGEKMTRARDAAIAALRRLGADDIVSVVAYDDVVQVIVPATPASDRPTRERAVRALEVGGPRAALVPAVLKCRDQLSRYSDGKRVRRIVVLSGGAPHVGDLPPADMTSLATQLMHEGITVSALAIGGADVSATSVLAAQSGGAHVTVGSGGDLGRALADELTAATAILARDVEVQIRCRRGVLPLRVQGGPASIAGDTMTARLPDVRAGGRRELLLAVKIDPAAGGARRLADVDVTFRDARLVMRGHGAQAVHAMRSVIARPGPRGAVGRAGARKSRPPVHVDVRAIGERIGDDPLGGLGPESN